jgi:hypothetical protein
MAVTHGKEAKRTDEDQGIHFVTNPLDPII